MEYMIATSRSTTQNQDKSRSNLQVWSQSIGEVCNDAERSDLACVNRHMDNSMLNHAPESSLLAKHNPCNFLCIKYNVFSNIESELLK